MEGTITSEVDGSESPTEDDQSNFGTGYGYRAGLHDGTLEVRIDGNWVIFATQEARTPWTSPSRATATDRIE